LKSQRKLNSSRPADVEEEFNPKAPPPVWLLATVAVEIPESPDPIRMTPRVTEAGCKILLEAALVL
jgi:hypothetical protein